MNKWWLALAGVGFLFIMMAYGSESTNVISLFSGIIYVIIGFFMYFRKPKNRNKKETKNGN